jgi:hypothetical protein
MPRRATSPAPTKLITLQKASMEYGPPYTSLRDLVLRGHLRAVRLGNSRRIWVLREDIEKLIEHSTIERVSA